MCCFQWDYRDACMATAGTLGCSLDFWHSLAVKKNKKQQKTPKPAMARPNFEVAKTRD